MNEQSNGNKKKLSAGAFRTLIAKKNVVYIVLIKFLTVLLSFLTVRVTLNYLDKELYGVWLPFLSVLSWINLFDVGIGHGLRNKLSEALAREDKAEGKIYVSTAYFTFGIFIVLIIVLYLFASPLIKWSIIFNIVTEFDLTYILNWLIIAYLFNFLLSLIKPVTFAHHDASFPGLITLSTNSIIYVGILLISSNFPKGNLTNIGLLYAFATVLFLSVYRRLLLESIKILLLKQILPFSSFSYSS